MPETPMPRCGLDPVDSREKAMLFDTFVLRDSDEFDAVVMLLDGDGIGMNMISLEKGRTNISRVAELLAEVSRESPLRQIVLFTVAARSTPTTEDRSDYLQFLELLYGSDLVLKDWIVVARDGGCASVAETFGLGSFWEN